jgi:hypothetical protein
MERLIPIVQFYADHFLAQLPQYGDFATFYGWLALASATVAALAALSVVFNRERGKEAAITVAQHVIVFGLPYLLGELL